MSRCTFFGHRDCLDSVKECLTEEIERCILQRGVDIFYIGHQGRFDAMAICVLKEMKKKYPHIEYYVVLAYHPSVTKETAFSYNENGILPDGIERVSPRYAINFRNRWMLERCDYVLAFVTRSHGGAAGFVSAAMRKGKTVINVAEKIT